MFIKIVVEGCKWYIANHDQSLVVAVRQKLIEKLDIKNAHNMLTLINELLSLAEAIVEIDNKE